MVQNTVFARATRFRKLILSALETRSAQGFFPDCSTAKLCETLLHEVPLSARSASLPSAITRGCRTDLDSKRSWKESYLPADKLKSVEMKSRSISHSGAQNWRGKALCFPALTREKNVPSKTFLFRGGAKS